jgi:DNA-binding HxlR family transcriptional regulator
MDCPIARTLDVVGECWSLLIVRDVIQGKRRFDEFQESLGIATNVLTARLKRLIEAGILERRPYQKNPVRYEYHLTEKGRQLGPIIRDLKNWGERFLPERRRSA